MGLVAEAECCMGAQCAPVAPGEGLASELDFCWVRRAEEPSGDRPVSLSLESNFWYCLSVCFPLSSLLTGFLDSFLQVSCGGFGVQAFHCLLGVWPCRAEMGAMALGTWWAGTGLQTPFPRCGEAWPGSGLRPGWQRMNQAGAQLRSSLEYVAGSSSAGAGTCSLPLAHF